MKRAVKLLAAAMAMALPAQAMAQEAIYVKCTFVSGLEEGGPGYFNEGNTLRLSPDGISRWNRPKADWTLMLCEGSNGCQIQGTRFTDSRVEMTSTTTYQDGTVSKLVFGVNRLTGEYSIYQDNSGGVPQPNRRIERGTCEAAENPATATPRKF